MLPRSRRRAAPSTRCTSPPKAKRVIFLYQAGGPSHLETFDYKPKLAKMHGKPMPESFTKGQQIAQLQGKPLICFGPQHGFKQFGKSGQEICELFPHIGSVADEICIVRSMWTRADQSRSGAHVHEHRLDHRGPAEHGLVGALRAGRGDRGSARLRRAVSAGRGGQMQPIAARQWSAGFLPSKFQGVKLNSIGDPVLYIDNPAGHRHAACSSDSIDAINALNAQRVSDGCRIPRS